MSACTLRVGALALVLAVPASAQIVFAPSVTTNYAPFSQSRRIAAGDVDGDGLADLVYGNTGAPSLRLGDGQGQFGAETPIATTATGGSVALADLNGDALLDLLVGSSIDASLHVAFNAGGGAFGTPVDYALGMLTPGQNQLGITTADADGDGDIDVLATTAGSFGGVLGEARLFRNLGAGELGTVGAVVGSSFGSGRVASGFPANLNGDDRPDLVVLFNAGIQFPDFSAKALLCQPDATFLALWSSAAILPMRAADLDNDGDQDLLSFYDTPPFSPPGDIVALLNAGDGSFVTGPETPVTSPNGMHVSALCDLDADGSVDMAAVTPFPTEAWFFRGAGDGSFAAPTARVTLSNTVSGGEGLLADFDGDGRLDLTCALGFSSATSFQAIVLNRTYAADGPLLDLGHQLEGSSWPIQIASGRFRAGQPFTFELSGAPASGAAFFIVGLSQLDAPFKGGTMVPLPFFIVGPLPASPSGEVNLAGLWPAGPSGIALLFQFWIPDAAGPVGFAASSGVLVTVP